MIQRIQTIWLFLIVLFCIELFFMPVIDNSLPGVCVLNVENGFTTFLSVVAIFLYKHRLLQIKCCYGIGILQLLFYITLYFIVRQMIDEHGVIIWRQTVFLPILISVSDILAGRAIWKDEQRVHSIDRLR